MTVCARTKRYLRCLLQVTKWLLSLFQRTRFLKVIFKGKVLLHYIDLLFFSHLSLNEIMITIYNIGYLSPWPISFVSAFLGLWFCMSAFFIKREKQHCVNAGLVSSHSFQWWMIVWITVSCGGWRLKTYSTNQKDGQFR